MDTAMNFLEAKNVGLSSKSRNKIALIPPGGPINPTNTVPIPREDTEVLS